MRLVALPWVGIAVLLAGCANLKVTKITPEERDSGKDHHVKGFRYYLSRPYVVVKQPIKVSEERSLLLVDQDKDPFNGLHKTLHADWLNQAVEAGAVKSVDPSTAATVPVSPAELAAMRSALVRQIAAGNPVANRAAVLPASASIPGEALASTGEEDSTNTGVGLLTDSTVPTASATKSVNLSGAIDVVFLPDLDEQYAVHNRNVVAKSSYALNFKDGWQLTGVNGEFDSTTVAVELLKTIDTAINTAKTVALAGLDARQRLLQRVVPATGENKARVTKDGKVYLIYEVVRVRMIPPGMYRINKPWEIGGDSTPVGCGLLEKMGLNAVESVTVIPAEPRTITQTAKDGVVYTNEQ